MANIYYVTCIQKSNIDVSIVLALLFRKGIEYYNFEITKQALKGIVTTFI